MRRAAAPAAALAAIAAPAAGAVAAAVTTGAVDAAAPAEDGPPAWARLRSICAVVSDVIGVGKARTGRRERPSNPVGLLGVGRGSSVEAVGDVVVAEPDDGVLTGQHGPKQRQVGPVQRVEAGGVATVVGAGSAQGVEHGRAFAVWCRCRQGVEVAAIGAGPHLEVAPGVGHTLSHLAPPPAPVSVVAHDPEDPELTRIVDRRLHSQHRGLVVGLDPVAGHPVLEPPPLGAALGLGEDLGLEGGMELAPEEAQHVLGRQVGRGVTDQVRPHREQLGAGPEQHVGGHLGLVQHPVVAAEAGPTDGGQQWVDAPGEGVEHPGPGPVGEAFAQLLGPLQVLDPQQGVVVTAVADAGAVELARQPLPAVDVDLDLIGHPGLDAHMHEAELGVDQVEVVVHALALPTGGLEAVGGLGLADLERPARLDHADDTHHPFGHAVAGGDGPGQVLLLLGAGPGAGVVEVDVGPARVGGEALGVVGDLLGGGLGIGGELLQRIALLPQQRRDGPRREQAREVALEDHPVEHRQGPYDAISVEFLEVAHGPLLHRGGESHNGGRATHAVQPAGCGRNPPPSESNAPRAFGCGRRLR